MSLLNSSYIPTHHASTPAGLGNMEMLGNLWSNNSLAFDSMSPSSWGQESHFPDLQDDLERELFGDGQASSADLSMAEILHICMTSDEATAPDHFTRAEGGGDMVSTIPPQASYDNRPDVDVQWEEGCGEGSRFLADFLLLPSGVHSQSTPGTPVGQVSEVNPMLLQHAEQPSIIAPDWRQPVGETSPFVDLSEFVSPPLASSRHLSAQQLACLKMQNQLLASTLETTHGGGAAALPAIPSTTQYSVKPRMTVEEQLRNFPVTFVSVRQQPATSDPAFEQLHSQWKSAPSPSKLLERDQSNSGPKRVNALAPVTPDRQRKRRTSARPIKVQKLQEPDSALEQAGLMQTQFLGIQAASCSFLVGNASNIQAPAPRDLSKAGDHVARERRRRDLMNTRYQTLESLLPPLPCRRDRFGIVEDTKLYVKEMEQKLSDLNKRREDCQTRLEAAQVAKTGLQQGKKEAAVPVPAVAGVVETSPSLTGFADSSVSGDLNVEVVIDQTDQEHDVVVFAQCRSSSGAKLLSSLLRAIEKLQLDVSQCSVSKSSQFFFCTAVCKLQPHVIKSSLSTEKMMQEMVTTLRPALNVQGSTEI